MTPEKLLEDISIRIWEPPFSDIHENGMLRQLENPLSVVVLLIAFDTEYNMNGILNFIGNSTGRYFSETIGAMKAVGSDAEAAVLSEIHIIAKEAGMTHEAIQEDMQEVAEFTVSSWNDVHGDRWEQAEDQIDTLGDKIDLEKLWNNAMSYVSKHQAAIEEKFSELG